MIDERAEKDKSFADISHINNNFMTKTEFNVEMIDNFNMFDSRERIETIISILEEQIDFDYYVKQNVIVAHYPLHKRDPSDIIDVFYEFLSSLKWHFVFGAEDFRGPSWYKKFTAINFVKSYYGEKYAFELAFLVHYQAWLQIPAFFGFIITLYQAYQYYLYKSVPRVIDNEFNGIYGLFLSIWSTLFIQSWKKKQEMIIFYWNLSEEMVKKDDERTSDFKFNMVFNEITKDMQKTQMVPKAKELRKQNMISYLYLFIVTLVLAVYVYFDGLFNKQKDQKVNEMAKTEGETYSYYELYKYDVFVNANVGVYSILIIILGIKYSEVAKKYTETLNFQFQSHYENQLITLYVAFNFLNFYLPLLMVAVLYTLFTYQDVFTLIGSQMAGKQIFANVIEYITPVLYTRKRLNKLNKFFEDVIYEEKAIEEFKELDENGNVVEQKDIKTKIQKNKRAIKGKILHTANKFAAENEDETSSENADSDDESSDDEWIHLDSTAEFALDY